MPVIDVRDGHSSGGDQNGTGHSFAAYYGSDRARDSSGSDRKEERHVSRPGGKLGTPDAASHMSHAATESSTSASHNNGFSASRCSQTSRDSTGRNNQGDDHATTDTPGPDTDTGTTKDTPTAKRRPSLREKFAELRLKAEEKKLNNLHQGEHSTAKPDQVGNPDFKEPNNSPTNTGKPGDTGARTRWIGSHLYRPRRLLTEVKSQAEEMDTFGDHHDHSSTDNVSQSTSGVSRNSSISSTTSTLSSGSRPFIFTSTEERLRAREEQNKEEQLRASPKPPPGSDRASPKPSAGSDTFTGKSPPESGIQETSKSSTSKFRTYLSAERQKIAEETNMPENSRMRNAYNPDATPPFQASPRVSPRAATRSGIRTPLFQTSPRESPKAAASSGTRTPPFQASPRVSPRAATRSGIRTPLFQTSPRESPKAAPSSGTQTPPFQESPRVSPRAATSSGTRTFRQTLQEDIDDGDYIRPKYGFAARQNNTSRESGSGARTSVFNRQDVNDTSRPRTRTSYFRQNLKEDLDDGNRTGTRTNVFRQTLKEDLDDSTSSGTRISNFRQTFGEDRNNRNNWGPSATEFLRSLYEDQDIQSDNGKTTGFQPNVQEHRFDGDNTFSPIKQQEQTQNGKYLNNQDPEPDFDFPEEFNVQANVVGVNGGPSFADLKRSDFFVQLAHTFLKHKQYEKAVEPLSKAIELCPTCASYYSNRAACYIMLGKFLEGLEDARQTTRIDPNFLKGYMREAKCLLMLGDPSQAISTYQKVLQLDPNNQSVADELKVAQSVYHFETQAEGDMKKGDFRRAVFCLDRALDHAPQCTKFKIKKAEALALLGRHTEAHDVVSNILHIDNMNVDAMYVRGLCLYYQDNLDKAFAHFQQVLRLSPDHEKAKVAFRKAKSLRAKKEEGNSAFKAGRYQEAYDLYSEALRIDPHNVFINSKLYNNRATVGAKVNKLDQAIQDCTEAIKLDDNYLKAYLRRAKCYMDTEQYEEAVRDYEKVFNMERTREHKQLLSNAKLELKKSKRKDYYKILGVRKDASDDEIKKAYKKKALETHPDRHSNATPEEKAEQERKFKEIGEAYATLSDSKKRVRYDNGQDIDDMDSPFSHDFDPNTIFQAFFGGGGGHGGQHFSFGGPGGPGRNFFRSSPRSSFRGNSPSGSFRGNSPSGSFRGSSPSGSFRGSSPRGSFRRAQNRYTQPGYAQGFSNARPTHGSFQNNNKGTYNPRYGGSQSRAWENMYKTSQPRPKPNPMYTFQTESQAGPGMKIFTSAQNLSEGQDNKRETEDKVDSGDSSSDSSSVPDGSSTMYAEAKFSSPLESLVRDEEEKGGEPESSTSRSRSSTSRSQGSKVRGDLTASAAKLEELNQKTPKEPQGARRRSSSAKSPIHIPGRRRSSFKEAKSRFEQSSPSSAEGRGEREGSQEFVFRDQGVPVYRKRSTSAGVRETETGGRRMSSPSPHRRTNLRQGLWRTRRLDEEEKNRGIISEDDRDADDMSSDFIVFDEDHYGGDKAKVPKETGEAVLDFMDFEEDHFGSPDDFGYGDKREETQEVTVNFSRESRKSRQEKGFRASGRNEVEIDPPPKAPARRKHSNKSKTNRTGQPSDQSDPVAPPRRKHTTIRSPAVEESDLGEPLAHSSPMLSRANSVPDFRNPPPFEDDTPPPSEYENPLYYRELSMSQRSWDTDSVIAIPTRSPLDGIRKRLSRVGRAFRLCMGRDNRVQRTFSDASTAGMVPKVEDTVD